MRQTLHLGASTGTPEEPGMSMEGKFINGEPSGEVTITYDSPQGSAELIKLTTDYTTFKNQTNGYATRTLKNGKVETIYLVEGTAYTTKEAYEASKKPSGNKSRSGISCKSQCAVTLRNESQICDRLLLHTQGTGAMHDCKDEAKADYKSCLAKCN